MKTCLQTRVLMIDDSPADARVLERYVGRISDFPVHFRHCLGAEDALREIEAGGVDCVLLDYSLGAETGSEVLRRIRGAGFDVPVIILTGREDQAVAVETLKEGAEDFLAKAELNPGRLQRAIINATEKVSLARQLAEKRENLEVFAHTAAHDLRSPLRTLIGILELLQRDVGQEKYDRVDEYVELVVDRAEGMTHLIEGLLEYTRVGRHAKVGTVNLNIIVGYVVDVLQLPIMEAGARVEVGPLPTVVGDELGLIQLFQNLIANAIKFRGPAPPVVEVGCEEVHGASIIHVRDNGIGIAKDDADRVFKPLTRLHDDRRYEGTGIGLATCKKIVDQHGGRIWIESEPDHGATFFLRLPAAVEHEATATAESAA